ncbi:MAG: 50S ribosomal protein L22 [Waddliaceae bacterium]|nr:50S ribosomal protein L22 [Waddliaceae bacterium]
MTIGKAITKYVRISPRKARLAANLIRGLGVSQAMTQLRFSQLKAGKLLNKTLMSAVANAEFQHDIGRDDLVVMEVRVDEGPTQKRARPKNRGGRVPIMKRTSHFTVVVGQGV